MMESPDQFRALACLLARGYLRLILSVRPTPTPEREEPLDVPAHASVHNPTVDTLSEEDHDRRPSSCS